MVPNEVCQPFDDEKPLTSDNGTKIESETEESTNTQCPKPTNNGFPRFPYPDEKLVVRLYAQSKERI